MASLVQFYVSGGAVGALLEGAPSPMIGQQVELDGDPYVVAHVVLAYWTTGNRDIVTNVHLEPMSVEPDGTVAATDA